MDKQIASLKNRRPYTKEQTDLIISETKDYIMEAVKEMIGYNGNELPNCYRLNPKIINPIEKETFRDKLYCGLHKKGFIDDTTSQENFKRVFSGEVNPTNFSKIKWKGKKQLSVYLIEKMKHEKIIDDWASDDNTVMKKMIAFFEPINPNSITKQVEKSIEHINDEFTMGGADEIDEIIENAMKK